MSKGFKNWTMTELAEKYPEAAKAIFDEDKSTPKGRSVAEAKDLKPSKYRNKIIEAHCKTFDSKKEHSRFLELQSMLEHNVISDLQTQVRYNFVVNGKRICAYVADFVYRQRSPFGAMNTIVEDVKSPITRKNPVYRIKRKLMMALYGIEIKET